MLSKRLPRIDRHFFLNNAIYIVLLILIVGLISINPNILSSRNISFILSQAAPRLILSLAIGSLLALGCTDLAAGRILGMVGLICASLLQSPDYFLRLFPNMPRLPIFIPLLICIVLVVIINIGHSFLTSKLKMAPFIASLGVQQINRSVPSALEHRYIRIV